MRAYTYYGYPAGSGEFILTCQLHFEVAEVFKMFPRTHALILISQVKCRRQVDSNLYKSNSQAWKMIYSKEGLRGVFFGWTPTFIGYSMQGAGKYGFYEVFKYLYGEKLAPGAPQTVVYLAASASAEFLADIALCPMEAIKVRMQTTMPPFANTLREGWSKVIKEEGVGGLYKPKESYGSLQQTGVSFLGGYIAGIGCAVVSHPAGMSEMFHEYQRVVNGG